MPRDWEAQFREWARPPGETERRKIEHAKKAVGDAIAASPVLQSHHATVHVQGSYHNRTNVPRERHVDVRVEITDTGRPDWHFVDRQAADDSAIRERLEREADLTDATYSYSQYKNDVGKALVAHFGPDPNVVRGDKAFDIHASTYRVDSDCLPAMQQWRYSRDRYGNLYR